MTRAFTEASNNAALGRNPIDAAKQAYAYSSNPKLGSSPNSVSDWRAFDHDICDDWAPPRPATQAPAPRPSSNSTFAAPAQPGPAGARPKLQLLPRSKPLPDASAPKEDSNVSSGCRASIFGNARPREEVLKERGVDPATDASRHPPKPVDVRPQHRHADADDHNWQVVSNGRPKAVSEFDGFVPAGNTGFAGGAARIFQGPGNHGAFVGGSFGSFNDDVSDDGPMFKRSLPTRSDLF